MNKYLLKFCLLASIANVSAASLSDPVYKLVVGEKASSVGGRVFSPHGKHGSVHGGPSSAFSGDESLEAIKNKFPAAVKVIGEGVDSTIAVNPTVRVGDFKAAMIDSLRLIGGHRYTLNGVEIMRANVGADGKLITLRQILEGLEGIPEIYIVKDEQRSPLQSKTTTPAPQSGGTSPATGGESPAVKPVDDEGAVSAASLEGTTPAAAAE